MSSVSHNFMQQQCTGYVFHRTLVLVSNNGYSQIVYYSTTQQGGMGVMEKQETENCNGRRKRKAERKRKIKTHSAVGFLKWHGANLLWASVSLLGSGFSVFRFLLRASTTAHSQTWIRH